MPSRRLASPEAAGTRVMEEVVAGLKKQPKPEENRREPAYRRQRESKRKRRREGEREREGERGVERKGERQRERER